MFHMKQKRLHRRFCFCEGDKCRCSRAFRCTNKMKGKLKGRCLVKKEFGRRARRLRLDRECEDGGSKKIGILRYEKKRGREKLRLLRRALKKGAG